MFQILSTRWQQQPQVPPGSTRHSVQPTFQEPHPRQASLGHILSGRQPASHLRDALPLECYRSLWLDRQRRSGLGKNWKPPIHSFTHSFLHQICTETLLHPRHPAMEQSREGPSLMTLHTNQTQVDHRKESPTQLIITSLWTVEIHN